MKNKGIMISLAAILLIGMIITTGTHNFIEKNSKEAQGTQLAALAAADTRDGADGGGEVMPKEMPLAAAAPVETMDEAAGEEPAERQPADFDEQEDKEAAASEKDIDFDKAAFEDAQPETAEAKQKVSLNASPVDEPKAESLGAEPGESAFEDPVSQQSQSYYVKRLQDLDSQIQKNRENQTGGNVNGSIKSAASNELKLWDSELNDIYNAILESLEPEESEKLVKEERAWLKERDSQAMDAAKKSAGGSSESIEYTISLKESTRKRAYELAERYEWALEE